MNSEDMLKLNGTFKLLMKSSNMMHKELGDVVNTMVREASMSDLIFGDRYMWDMKQLMDISIEFSLPCCPEVKKAYESTMAGMGKYRKPDNVESLCRSILPFIDDSGWVVDARDKKACDLRIKVNGLVANILRKYIGTVSEGLRKEIEPKLVFHDL